MAKPTVTNAELGRKLDDAAKIMLGHMDRDEKQFDAILAIFNGSGDTPGIKTRLDRLEQVEGNRKWSLRVLWAAVVTAIVAYLFK